MSSTQKVIRVFIAVIIISSILLVSVPRPAEALTFGGRIVSSQYRVCHIYVGVALIPFPLQVVRITRTGYVKTIVYTYYQTLLQLFGVSTSLYNYYQFYRSGPSVLGTYIPLPVPWTDCPDLYPTNLILKIGTSLF